MVHGTGILLRAQGTQGYRNEEGTTDLGSLAVQTSMWFRNQGAWGMSFP